MNIFTKACTKNWSREIFMVDSDLKTNLWTYRIKNLTGEKNRKFLWKKM